MVKQVFLVGGCAKETSKMPKSISLAFHRNVLEPSGAWALMGNNLRISKGTINCVFSNTKNIYYLEAGDVQQTIEWMKNYTGAQIGRENVFIYFNKNLSISPITWA